MSASIFPRTLTHEMSKLGMWLFLATEVLLFAGLFSTYGVYRYWYGAEFKSAAQELSVTLGAVNTVILLFSSFTVAWAVDTVKRNLIKATKTLLWVTLLCGFAFLTVKYFEYSAKIHHGLFPSQLAMDNQELDKGKIIFFFQYFIMTGVHGLHVVIGIGIWIYILTKLNKGTLNSEYYTHIEVGGLYWHLVDLIWIFVFPLLYLVA